MNFQHTFIPKVESLAWLSSFKVNSTPIRQFPTDSPPIGQFPYLNVQTQEHLKIYFGGKIILF